MRRLAILFPLLLTPAFAAAQRPAVTGRAAEAGGGVAYATVTLLRGDRQAAGGATDAEGRFRLTADTGRYLLSLRHVGYEPLERPLHLGPQGLDLGELRLTAAGIGPVTVTAEAVTRESDRFVVSVGDGPAFAGRDGEELLRLAPGVRIGDEGISVNGASGTQVYVDGRKLKGSAEQTASYLRSLTAADIARIEVVPQTGAEFAADARGGVILITLRRRRADGLDGHLQAATTQSSGFGVYAPSGRLGIRSGRWTVSASAAGVFTPRAESHFTESRSYPFSGKSRTEGRSNYGRGEFAAIFDPSPHHTAGLSAEYTARGLHMPTASRTELSGTTTDSRYRQRADGGTLTLTANYVWRIDTLGSELKLIADYTRYASDGANDYRTRYTSGTDARDSLYRSDDRSRYDILTAELSLTHRLAHGLTLHAGGRCTRNGMDDRSRYEARQDDTWHDLAEYGYARRYTEQTGAAYVSLALKRGRWDLSAGLRGEYTAIGSESLDRSYFGLFPNLSANYALNGLRTWMLAAQWSRNIERPSFPALNPVRIQLSDYSYQTGNPALRPTYIHRLSLTLIWRYRYVLSIGGNLHRDLIREVASADAANPDAIRIRPENHCTENHWFAFLTLPLKITRWWELKLNAVGVAQRIRLERRDTPATHGLLFADATAAFTLPAEFYVEAVYRCQSRLYSGNSEVGPRHTLGATVKKRLCKKRLTLFLTAQNLMDCGWEFVSRTDGMRRVVKGRQPWSGRAWKIGASWNFSSGERFRTRKVESAADSERSRLAKTDGQSK